MDIDDAVRILLNGVTGCNDSVIRRGTGLSRSCVAGYVNGTIDTPEANREKIYFFVWRQLNAHLLLCDTDRTSLSSDAIERSDTVTEESSVIISVDEPRANGSGHLGVGTRDFGIPGQRTWARIDNGVLRKKHI